MNVCVKTWRIVTTALVGCCLFFLPGYGAAEDYDFWVQTPTQWNNKTDRLGKDLKKQVMAPGGDAFIEVYAAKGNNIGVQAIADGMEQTMRQRNTAYLQNRISSRNIQADGQPAILREYTGLYNGIPLRAFALYAYGNGGAFAVFGVFVTGQSARYQDTVYTCVTSLRFSPPGLVSGGGGSPYDIAGAAGGGAAASGPGCGAIVGKWHWFTGSTAEFGPNGHIPGSGHHWECLDNGRTFRILWNNGKWVDTLTLSENGQRLEGKNQTGSRVWGTRIGTPPAGGPAMNQSAGNDGAGGDCCSYFGLWNFVPPGIHGTFMPDHRYGERSKGFRYTCGGGRVTIDWGNGTSTTWLRQSPTLLTRKDKWGNPAKATRVRDTVTVDGKIYKACAGGTAAPSAGIVPKADRVKGIKGNMGSQWGFAHGSLSPSDPSIWELSTARGATLNCLDPYKKGKQHYWIRAFSPSGAKAAETDVRLSGQMNLGPGTYRIEVTTDIHYAGWRCEWK